METYIISGTGFASGVNRTDNNDDVELSKVMSDVITQAVNEGCESVEINRRMLEARDKYRRDKENVSR
jgi:hypothetical protein